jgi:spermidine synthase
MTSRRFMIPLAYGVFLLAGVAGLGYQVIWARMLLAGLGHEMPALLAVVAAFMCGLALGAGALDRPIGASRRPALWFAALQAVAGFWGMVTVVLIPWLNPVATGLLGTSPTPLAQWTIAFGFPAMALLPATAALGASFAAMERIVAGLSRPGRHVAALYAVNTLGAALGVIWATGWLMPLMGLRMSALLFACIPLFGAVLALSLGRDSETPVVPAPESAALSPEPWPRHRLAIILALTGLLGIGYQLLVVRVLAQVLDNTIYTYATVLTVYLMGTALGAAGYRRLLPLPEFRSTLVGLCGVLAVTCLLGILVLGQCQNLIEGMRAAFPATWAGRVLLESVMVTLVLVPSTVFMGATWSHLVQASRRPDGGIGGAIAVNALGAAAAPICIGVMLLPVLGAKWALTLIALGYLALAPRPRGWQWVWLTAPLGLVVLLPANLRILDLSPGAEVVAWRESLLGSVAVIGEPDRHRTLRVDNRFQMGGTGSAEMAARHAHLALLLHPKPKRGLVLGVGTGLTFGAATIHPGLEADGVELVPRVIELMPWFEPENRQASRQPQLRMHAADARRFVLANRDSYDVIIGDLFHPARDGAGLLYTREHFSAIRERLAPGGLFCQWLPLHQMGEDTLRLITRTFLEVFPDTQAWLLRFNVEVPVIGLVGYTVPPPFHPRWIEQRIGHAPLGAELRAFALADSLRFFGHWLAGREELESFAGPGPLNTDDHPRVMFLAARQPVSRAADTHRRLELMLRLRQPGSICWPASASGDGDDGASFLDAWNAFVNARDVYLEGLIHEAEGHRERAIDAFIESARLSREFTAGYAQCLTIVSLLAPTQPAAARALLERLAEAQPAIPVARQMLERLTGSDENTEKRIR